MIPTPALHHEDHLTLDGFIAYTISTTPDATFTLWLTVHNKEADTYRATTLAEYETEIEALTAFNNLNAAMQKAV